MALDALTMTPRLAPPSSRAFYPYPGRVNTRCPQNKNRVSRCQFDPYFTPQSSLSIFPCRTPLFPVKID